MKNKIKTTVTKVTNFIKREYLALTLLAYGMLAPVNTAMAEETTAEEKWNAVIDFIIPWITRLGGVVILIGAVEFGLAWKNDDAEGKTKGMRTIIAGCIVFAVGASSSTFLA